MTAVEFEPADRPGTGQVIDWRLEELERAGYDHKQALAIASHTEIDLHGAIDLLRRGCTPALAARILL